MLNEFMKAFSKIRLVRFLFSLKFGPQTEKEGRKSNLPHYCVLFIRAPTSRVMKSQTASERT